MRFSVPLVLLVAVGASAGTVKKVVEIPAKTNLSGLCASWKTECAKEAAALGYGSLFFCKSVGPTSARVACVSKDFFVEGVPELQLTLPVLKALKLTQVHTTSPVPIISSKVANVVVPTTTPTKKKDLTVKRTVTIPAGTSIDALQKEWKAACSQAAVTRANSGFLFRVKAVGTGLASVTCVSKNFADKTVPEQQLTEYVIAELKLVVKA